jgi:probable phosphoglycerate mutase
VRTLIVEADGASRGNPGEASYGAVVRDADSGELLAELAEALGRATNNVAEYRGVIAGLDAVRRIDPAARVDVRLDSKLVVEQLSGRWQVKHPDMKPLAERARALFPDSGEITFTWVPRSQNKHADRLANEALNAAAKGEVWASKTPAVQGAAVSASVASPRLGWAADLGRPTRLLLLRHGVTPLTGEKRFSGLGDPELTSDGLAQARAAARRLAGGAEGDAVFGPIDVIVASPLRRTQQTAQAVAELAGLEVHTDEGFREMDFGGLEGLSFAEARARYPDELTAFLSSVHTAAPGGESVEQAGARAAAARDRTASRFARKTVLIVTHVTPIKTLTCQALGAPLDAVHRMELSAASLTVVDLYGDGISNVRCVNDTAHLR